MELLEYQLDNLDRDSVTLTDDNPNIIPSRLRHHHKTKQARKASTSSVRDDGKKSKIRKHRSSMAQTTHDISETLRFVETSNLKTNDGYDPSSSQKSSVGHEHKSDEVVQHLAQMTLDEGQMSQYLLRNETMISKKDENWEDDINLTTEDNLNLLKQEEQRCLALEEKLAQDHTFDTIGVMNLSSMNLTDHDIPTIIQRAYRKKRNKCFGLIFRDNALTSEGVRMFVDALLTMQTKLNYLNFSDNLEIGDSGIEHLTRLLQENRSINFLAINNTGITDRGVRILADTLCGANTDSPCAPLEKLYMSFNKSITDESLEPLLQIIQQNLTLQVLALRHCSLSNKARRRLTQASTKIKKRKFSLAE